MVYKHAFELEASSPATNGKEKSSLLEEVYIMWRDSPSNSKNNATREEAAFTYASYLIRSGSLKQAHTIINNLLASTHSETLRADLELKWKDIIEAPILGNGEMIQEEDDLEMADDSTSHVESDDDYSLAISQ
jgi:hypothetical protein